jgi:hypothetical protein
VGEHRRVIRPRTRAPRHPALWLGVVAVALAAAGCRRGRQASDEGSAAAPQAPVDRVAPGELAEGSDKAFGLPIPRVMRVRARFSNAIYAQGPVAPDHLANYVRKRVEAKHAFTGPGKTVFTGATPKGEPGKVLRVEVVSRAGEVELLVRDETPPPDTGNPTPAERMRAVGLRPDGTPLDTTRLE